MSLVNLISFDFQNLQREVDAGASRLHLMSDNPHITRNVSFTQPKILLLWGDILKSNFTNDERESLKVIFSPLHIGNQSIEVYQNLIDKIGS